VGKERERNDFFGERVESKTNAKNEYPLFSSEFPKSSSCSSCFELSRSRFLVVVVSEITRGVELFFFPFVFFSTKERRGKSKKTLLLLLFCLSSSLLLFPLL